MVARSQFSSRLGFILAASGSAIGLGNIVFFSANAYKFGAGAFYLPYLLALEGNGTVGLTLLDLIDHWAFSYGLMLTGLAECLIVGWVLGPKTLRDWLNAYGEVKVGAWFDPLIRYLIPAVLVALLAFGAWGEIRDGLYGHALAGAGTPWAVGALVVWLGTSVGLGVVLTWLDGEETA